MGGGGDADAADGIAGYLAERYTVVTYDRRGMSRSTLDDPNKLPTIQTHGDDAHRLLTEVTAEPAFVLGTSLGALIARSSKCKGMTAELYEVTRAAGGAQACCPDTTEERDILIELEEIDFLLGGNA